MELFISYDEYKNYKKQFDKKFKKKYSYIYKYEEMYDNPDEYINIYTDIYLKFKLKKIDNFLKQYNINLYDKLIHTKTLDIMRMNNIIETKNIYKYEKIENYEYIISIILLEFIYYYYLYELCNYEKANNLLLIIKKREESDIYYDKANNCYNKDIEDKKYNYLKAIELNHSEAMTDYAIILYDENKKTEAIIYFEKAIKLYNISAMLTYSKILEENNKLDEAERLMKLASKVHFDCMIHYDDFKKRNNMIIFKIKKLFGKNNITSFV